MTKEEVYRDIEETFGFVPTFMKYIPDRELEHDWAIFKSQEMTDEGPIPFKYRELIGLAVSAAIKCRYCSYVGKEVAKMAGATEDEIREAIYLAKYTEGWSALVNGMQPDYEEFKAEIDRMLEFVKQREERESREPIAA